MANGVVEWSRSAREVARVAFYIVKIVRWQGAKVWLDFISVTSKSIELGRLPVLHIAKERTLAISLALT